MLISSKGKYALRVMIDIATNKDNIQSIKNIAEREDISEKYLEQIMSLLYKSNLVISFRGATGGYKLARDCDKISVGEILKATEGDMSIVECMNNDCERQGFCKTKNYWIKLNNLINNYLNTITLKDIIEDNI